jgi:hypothetical protein
MPKYNLPCSKTTTAEDDSSAEENGDPVVPHLVTEWGLRNVVTPFHIAQTLQFSTPLTTD